MYPPNQYIGEQYVANILHTIPVEDCTGEGIIIQEDIRHHCLSMMELQLLMLMCYVHHELLLLGHQFGEYLYFFVGTPLYLKVMLKLIQ